RRRVPGGVRSAEIAEEVEELRIDTDTAPQRAQRSPRAVGGQAVVRESPAVGHVGASNADEQSRGGVGTAHPEVVLDRGERIVGAIHSSVFATFAKYAKSFGADIAAI